MLPPALKEVSLRFGCLVAVQTIECTTSYNEHNNVE